MLKDLEASGGLLSTFDRTYSDFKGLIEKTKTRTTENACQIGCIASSRKLRRKYGAISNFCLEPIDLDSIRPRLEAFL